MVIYSTALVSGIVGKALVNGHGCHGVEGAVRCIASQVLIIRLSADHGSIVAAQRKRRQTQPQTPLFTFRCEHGPELVYFNGGEQVMTAEETAAMRESMEIQAITFAPQLLEALHAIHGDGALSAEPGAGSGAGSVELQIVFQINGSASSETVEALREYGDEFAERVLEVIEEAEYDRRRVSFT